MAHVKVVERWEDGKPTPTPPDAKVRTHSGGGGKFDPFFFKVVYVDDYLLLLIIVLLGMVVTPWVMLELVGDRADAKADPILMRGDNTVAVSWISRCGGARDKRACLLMRMLRRLEIKGAGTTLQNSLPAYVTH